MIKSKSIAMIREKAQEGKTAYAIGKELGISKNTVKKYMEMVATEQAKYPARGSKLDPYKAEINRLMKASVFNCVVLMERICELGYDGKISILKDYVWRMRAILLTQRAKTITYTQICAIPRRGNLT